MEALEKPARNLMIRKFSELIGMRTLEEAVNHLKEKPIYDAVGFLYKAYPENALIKRRNRTLEMTMVIDELKSQMIQAEKQNLLNALQMEDKSLENQIKLTKNAIDQREQAKILTDEALQKFKQQDNIINIFELLNDDLIQAIALLEQADPASYGEPFSFLSLLKELKGMNEMILESDQNSLLAAIRSGSFEKLNEAILKAKTVLNQQKALNTLLTKYLQAAAMDELFQNTQNEIIKNEKSFWKSSPKDPKKIAEIQLFNYAAEILRKDSNLSLEEKANILFSIMILLNANTKNAKSPILAATFEIAITEFTKHPLYNQTNREDYLFRSYQYIANGFDNAPLSPKEQQLFKKIKPAEPQT